MTTKNLHPLIVSIRRTTAVIDGADRPICEAEHDDDGVQVTNLSNCWIYHHAAGCEQLYDLAPHEIAGHVEVVDGHIKEDTTGDLEVLQRRGRRVTADNMQQLGFTDHTILHELLCPPKVTVETPVEAHHQPDTCVRHCLQRGVNTVKIQVDGLLAEDILARLCSGLDQICMGIGTRAHHHRLDLWVRDNPHSILVDLRHTVGGCLLTSNIGPHIGHRHHMRLGDSSRQMPQMQSANSPYTNYTYVHRSTHPLSPPGFVLTPTLVREPGGVVLSRTTNVGIILQSSGCLPSNRASIISIANRPISQRG